jgi:hypothetical protein
LCAKTAQVPSGHIATAQEATLSRFNPEKIFVMALAAGSVIASGTESNNWTVFAISLSVSGSFMTTSRLLLASQSISSDRYGASRRISRQGNVFWEIDRPFRAARRWRGSSLWPHEPAASEQKSLASEYSALC